jgi:hypothetical protein
MKVVNKNWNVSGIFKRKADCCNRLLTKLHKIYYDKVTAEKMQWKKCMVNSVYFTVPCIILWMFYLRRLLLFPHSNIVVAVGNDGVSLKCTLVSLLYVDFITRP